MTFWKKKESLLDRRLDDLRKEMQKVDQELKSLNKGERNERSFPAKKEPTFRRPAPVAPVAVAPGAVDEKAPVPSATGNDLFSHAARSVGQGGVPESAQRNSRARFAQYFMAGHFQNLRPLRQENRIVRNKAIVMIVLAVISLIWLLVVIF